MRSAVLATTVMAFGAMLLHEAKADEGALRGAVSLPAAAMWLDYKAPGLILAVVRGNDAAVLGFGETAPGSGVAPDGRTIVRIGSIAKAFAGQLLADLASEGKVRLADPAQRYLPEFKLPEAGGRAITLIVWPRTPLGCLARSRVSRLRTAIRSSPFLGRTTKCTSQPRRSRVRRERPPPTRTSGSACSAARWRGPAASPMRR